MGAKIWIGTMLDKPAVKPKGAEARRRFWTMPLAGFAKALLSFKAGLSHPDATFVAGLSACLRDRAAEHDRPAWRH